MNKLFFFLFLALCFSCENEQSTTSDDQIEIEPPRMAAPTAPAIPKGSKIIKTGNLDIEVVDLISGKRTIDSLLRTHDAYYEHERYSAQYNRLEYALQIRIPSLRFDSMLLALENNVGRLTDKDISVKDVTEEYVDLAIRLENNLAYLDQYKEILKKTKSIEDILAVQGKIRRIEEEIESKKGRIKYLNNQASFSTLHITLTEPIETIVSHAPKFGQRIARAFNNGIDGFLGFLIILINVWPFLMFVILVAIFRTNLLKVFRKHQ